MGLVTIYGKFMKYNGDRPINLYNLEYPLTPNQP